MFKIIYHLFLFLTLIKKKSNKFHQINIVLQKIEISKQVHNVIKEGERGGGAFPIKIFFLQGKKKNHENNKCCRGLLHADVL